MRTAARVAGLVGALLLALLFLIVWTAMMLPPEGIQ